MIGTGPSCCCACPECHAVDAQRTVTGKAAVEDLIISCSRGLQLHQVLPATAGQPPQQQPCCVRAVSPLGWPRGPA